MALTDKQKQCFIKYGRLTFKTVEDAQEAQQDLLPTKTYIMPHLKGALLLKKKEWVGGRK